MASKMAAKILKVEFSTIFYNSTLSVTFSGVEEECTTNELSGFNLASGNSHYSI